MAKINEEKVKNLVIEYKNGNESVINQIIKEISLYIYNFPIIVYNRPRDEAGEFYIYFMERIENCIKGFSDRGYKFSTYLTHVLINMYKNFLIQNRKTLKIIYESEVEGINLLSVIHDEETQENNILVDKVTEFFNNCLDEFSKLIIKTFIFELSPEDLTLIAKYTKKSIKQVIGEYEEILEKVRIKYQKRKKLIEEINKNPTESKLKKLKELNTLCGYSDVGKLLNLTVSNVGVSLKRIRDKFKSYIKQKC